MGRSCAARLAEVEPGHAVFEATPGEQHYNPIGFGFFRTACETSLWREHLLPELA